jgi:hypothetical protein
MDAITTETVEQGGQTYRITVYADGDAPNPLDDWSEMGTILSLNCRHGNFDPEGINAAIEGNPDAVPLSYYEHGQCLWSVAGELPAHPHCLWDSMLFAGVWLPDIDTLESARPYGGRTRHHFMRKRARQACDTYTQWCNGEIYGFEVSRLVACGACGGERSAPVDSCWGIYGLEDCLSEARASVATSARSEPTTFLQEEMDSRSDLG